MRGALWVCECVWLWLVSVYVCVRVAGHVLGYDVVCECGNDACGYVLHTCGMWRGVGVC